MDNKHNPLGNHKTIGGRYNSLIADRDAFLERARDAAKLTIPSLMPPEGHSGSTRYYTPFQGLGARGVNNLASKLLLALMPPSNTFFRFTIDDYTLEQMTNQDGMRAEVEEALSKIERAIMTEIDVKAIRVSVSEALKQLIVAGNVLLYLAPEGLKVFRLDRYVVKRDTMGNVLEIIVHETIAYEALPEDVRKALDEEAKFGPKKDCEDREYDLYTHVKRTEKEWEVAQEVKGMVLEDTKGTYPLEASPWIALRFAKIDDEDYGRGYIEEYYGDLRSLETLAKAIVQGSAMAAKVLFLVNPNGTTTIKSISESENGDVIYGNAQEVTTLQMDKFADFNIAAQTSQEITQRLSYAFLMNTAVQRGGERVTAEEIRYMAGELDDALGGIYAILSVDFQLPLVTRLQLSLQKQGKIPSLPKGTVRPAITTGLAALGRGQDLSNLDTFIAGIAQTFGPEVVARYLNVSDYLKRRGTALGIDMGGLVYTEEEVQAKEQQQQQALQQQQSAQMMGAGGIDMAKEVVKGAVKNNGS